MVKHSDGVILWATSTQLCCNSAKMVGHALNRYLGLGGGVFDYKDREHFWIIKCSSDILTLLS